MARALTSWLKDKDPDVWFATTRYLNWDNSFRTLKWIVSQSECDKANIAEIFWLAGPAYHACELAKTGTTRQSETWGLIQLILANWRAGFYVRSELAWPDREGKASIDYYIREVAAIPGAEAALSIPRDLFGPFHGREPRVPPNQTPQEDAELWDMLKRQGTWAGERPGSEEWQDERARAAQAARKPGFWERLLR